MRSVKHMAGDVRVTTVAVSDKLQEQGPFIFINSPPTSILDGLPSGYDVHSVHLVIVLSHQLEGIFRKKKNQTNLQTRALVTASEILRVRAATFSGSTHAILVVFTDEDGWEIPKLSLAR